MLPSSNVAETKLCEDDPLKLCEDDPMELCEDDPMKTALETKCARIQCCWASLCEDDPMEIAQEPNSVKVKLHPDNQCSRNPMLMGRTKWNGCSLGEIITADDQNQMERLFA